MSAPAAPLAPFPTREREALAARLGMWTFLATEIMFFGPLFLAYVYGRTHYPQQFAAASRHTDVVLGSVNTALLLTSSACMALAVAAAEWEGKERLMRAMLLATAALGVVFLMLKGMEYREDWQERLVPGLRFATEGGLGEQAMLFFYVYFATTGLHAVHLGIGIVLVLALAWRSEHRPPNRLLVDNVGLYWHFVDIVWIFLYPMLYLFGRAG